MRSATCTICLRDSGPAARGPAAQAAPRSALGSLDIRTAYPYRTPYYDVQCTKPEGLGGRRFGDTEALSGLDLARRAGHGARAARPQRRGQDDRRAHPHHAAGADAAGARSSTATTSSPTPRAVRESISLAGQQATLDERLTGRENLMLIARLQRLAKRDAAARGRRAAGALRDRARRRPPGRDLQRRDAAAAGPRRLPGRAPARRLPRRADDRPGPGRRRADMWGAIEGLVQDGAALVLTTQYLEEADRLADEIVVLSGGRTVAAGTPARAQGARRRAPRARLAAGGRRARHRRAAVRAPGPRARRARPPADDPRARRARAT